MNKTIALVISLIVAIVSSKSVESDTTTVPFHIYNAATKFKIDVALLYAFCRVESNCRAKAINHDDGTPAQKALGIIDKSYGLFQIKASTAQGLGFEVIEKVKVTTLRHGKSRTIVKTINHTKDLLKPEVNAWYAAKLLRHLYDRYGDTVKVISAYNAGHPTKANDEYVSKVLKQYARYKIDHRF